VVSRIGINALEEVRSILSSNDATRCVRHHGISFDAIWPRELLRGSSDEKIRNFVVTGFRMPGRSGSLPRPVGTSYERVYLPIPTGRSSGGTGTFRGAGKAVPRASSAFRR